MQLPRRSSPARRGFRSCTVGVLLVLSACTSWRRDDQVLQQPVPERKPLQLFVEGRSRVVHGVRADSATISAVPRHRNPACDSCRVAFLRGVIDSVRVRRVSESRTVLLLSGIIAFIFIPDWPEKSPT